MNRYLRRTARTYLSIATILALAGAATACSPGGDDQADGNKLTMWTFKQSHVAALQKAAETFKQKTGIAVTVEAVTPDDAFIARVQAAAQTRGLPDVFEVHTNGDDFTFGAAGLLEDLTEEATWTNRYLPSVAAEGTVTERYYKQSQDKGAKTAGIKLNQRFSVPLTIGTFGIVYANKERLTAAGVTGSPKTWEEFVAALEAVRKVRPDDGGLSIGFQAPTTGMEWLMQPMAYGKLGKAGFTGLFSNDPAKNWTSAAGRAVLQTYDQVTPYWMPGTQTLTIDDADIAFAQGRSSFDIGGTFTLAFLVQNGMKADNIVTFPVPSPSGGAVPELSLAPFALTGLSVSATTGNKDGAVKWLDHLAQPEVAAQFAKDALDVPPVDLGADPTATLGPVLGAMISSFGSGAQAYNPGDTTHQPPSYDAAVVARSLMELTPLKKADVPTAGAGLQKIIDGYWAGK
ncbi:extracellular solute-binding protein [Plantactinospora sp. S1510]|uniref:Extracellular solute-binding protein n=1 Tax=Plantactinospora alkalitolerans TaxID=2789879 RepID=A0ABS0GYJ7_9ACTN|nr:extracellular solute-binding protein [Plantactinospora alkalitolerans]MBF9131298.1 extracellular solute-binding protein [Plantactinospora alkalitolerans]